MNKYQALERAAMDRDEAKARTADRIAELEYDRERLEWIFKRSASLEQLTDGRWIAEGGGIVGKDYWSTGVYDNPRDAIDAAMEMQDSGEVI